MEIKNSKLEGYKALSAVGVELIGKFEKDKQGRGYKYIELHNFTAAIRDSFAKHGLLILQPLVFIDGRQMLRTVIYHVSCEDPIEESMLDVGLFCMMEDPIDKETKERKKILHDGQKIGAGITYARKYAIQSILCISTGEKDLDDPSLAGQNNSDTPKETKKEVKQTATVSKSGIVPTKKETATPSKEEEEAKKKDPRYIAAMKTIQDTYRDKEVGFPYICNESKARKIRPQQINILSISELEDIVSRIPTKHEEI